MVGVLGGVLLAAVVVLLVLVVCLMCDWDDSDSVGGDDACIIKWKMVRGITSENIYLFLLKYHDICCTFVKLLFRNGNKKCFAFLFL